MYQQIRRWNPFATFLAVAGILVLGIFYHSSRGSSSPAQQLKGNGSPYLPPIAGEWRGDTSSQSSSDAPILESETGGSSKATTETAENEQNARPSPTAATLERPFPTLVGPQFTPGVPEPNRDYRKALIISSIRSDDWRMDWVDEKLPHEIDVFRYVNDDPKANLSVPMNKGNEVMTYLTFLIDHYDNLPDVMIFVHAHEVTFHNPYLFHGNTANMVQDLSPQRVIREGYMNMHCGHWDAGSCPAGMRPAEREDFTEVWHEMFPEYPVPEVLAQWCCAQFAVSRERALQIPREKFIEYRQWIIDTELPNKISGYFWEYLWQFVFTGRHVVCPEMHQCWCDGYGYCFGDKKAFQAANDLFIGIDKIKIQIGRMEEELEDGEELSKADQAKKERMHMVIDDMRKEVWWMVDEAKERGKDPKIRADESKRPWKKGDGFN